MNSAKLLRKLDYSSQDDCQSMRVSLKGALICFKDEEYVGEGLKAPFEYYFELLGVLTLLGHLQLSGAPLLHPLSIL